MPRGTPTSCPQMSPPLPTDAPQGDRREGDCRQGGHRNWGSPGATRVILPHPAAPQDTEREEEDEEEGDWWSKFYMAMGDTAKSHRRTHRDSLKVRGDGVTWGRGWGWGRKDKGGNGGGNRVGLGQGWSGGQNKGGDGGWDGW